MVWKVKVKMFSEVFSVAKLENISTKIYFLFHVINLILKISYNPHKSRILLWQILRLHNVFCVRYIILKCDEADNAQNLSRLLILTTFLSSIQ